MLSLENLKNAKENKITIISPHISRNKTIVNVFFFFFVYILKQFSIMDHLVNAILLSKIFAIVNNLIMNEHYFPLQIFALFLKLFL